MRLLISVFLFSITLSGIAQKYYFTGISGGISLLGVPDIETTDNKPGLEFSGGIGRDFLTGKSFSMSVELDYFYSKAGFMNKYEITAIPEDFYNFRHEITTQSLILPLMIKYQTGKPDGNGVYFFAGPALKYIFHTYRNTEIVKTTLSDPDKEEVTPFAEGNTSLDNKGGSPFGFSGIAGIGKDFTISNLKFYATARYHFDMNKWQYENADDASNPVIDIRQQGINIGLGVRF